MFLSRTLHYPAFSSISKKSAASRETTRGAKSIHFFTTCPEAWGGSEELWARSARAMASSDEFQVKATLSFFDINHPEVVKLLESGVCLENYRGVPFLRRYGTLYRRWEKPLTIARLRASNPELAVISQGENMDGGRQMYACCHDLYLTRAGESQCITLNRAGVDSFVVIGFTG